MLFNHFDPLDRRTIVLPSRKLVIRAARAEFIGMSRIFRSPDFEDGPDYMAEEKMQNSTIRNCVSRIDRTRDLHEICVES